VKIYVFSYLISGLAFIALDFAWLSIMAKVLYRPLLGDMILEKFKLLPALAFYLLYPVGIAVFAVVPALTTAVGTTAIIHGLLFGLLAYATYNLTNQATLRNWSPVVTAIDLDGAPHPLACRH
jgi:uncharacterized membrane protein